ncbi:unnamed protein product [Rotaria sordida]|uniref:Uncharacterized protein n=1 Tax=Rotaria sordida TaxID=392033 RepID=A0A818Q6J8_9BILA|nr:unnamed protein product [Rotaria sordida]CAF1093411.1 unnamed protein product [Rotaria sordida]CAF1233441.1 unnamed protein product [Rotaria sordida]CAF1274941.1 unnamed protein product [Rotaria sordida]CAF1514844.1 unnamed protein product [Rotaria sordida]
MLNQTTMNNTHDHHPQNIIIGDILLHLESKPTIIQVVTHTILSTASSLIVDKPIIRRLSPNSSGTSTSQTIISCDLKNNLPIKSTHERIKTSSKKKLMRVPKASMALVKEWKSKVTNPTHPELKSYTTNTNIDNEHTYF